MIRPQPFSLSSAATTPLILVPNSSLLLFKRTAALSSNRIERPSARLVSFFVRTTTARRISPLRTLFDANRFDDDEDGPDEFWGIGRARLITHTISSPIRAWPCRPLNLRTLMHSAISPPELSMISIRALSPNMLKRKWCRS